MSASDERRPVADLGVLLREQARHVPMELLVRYERREGLTDGERIMVEEHVASCERCGAQLRLQQRFTAELAGSASSARKPRSLMPTPVRHRLRTALRRPAFGWAAAAVLALVLLGRGGDEDGKGVLMGGEPPIYSVASGGEPLVIVRGALPESIRLRAPTKAPWPGRYLVQLEDPEGLRALSVLVESDEGQQAFELLVPSAWLQPGPYRLRITRIGDDPLAEFTVEVIE